MAAVPVCMAPLCPAHAGSPVNVTVMGLKSSTRFIIKKIRRTIAAVQTAVIHLKPATAVTRDAGAGKMAHKKRPAQSQKQAFRLERLHYFFNLPEMTANCLLFWWLPVYKSIRCLFLYVPAGCKNPWSNCQLPFVIKK